MRAPTGFAANKRPPATSIRIRPSSDVEDRTELETRANSMRWTLATGVPGVNDVFLGKNGLSPLARAIPRAARAARLLRVGTTFSLVFAWKRG